MRRLMLLRHAKSDWSGGAQRDIDRPLAPRGREVAPVMGRYLAEHGLVPDRILVSTARRTRETWDLVAPAFRRPPLHVPEPRLYEAGLKALVALVQETDPDTQSLMLIGHNPGLQELAAKLMANGEVEARQRLLQKFPTAALAVLDFASDDWRELKPSTGRLDRFVTPRMLRLECD